MPSSFKTASCIRALKAGYYPGLCDVLGEEVATGAELMALGQQFFAALYGRRPGASMTQARYNLYTRKRGKPLPIMSLPVTEKNLLYHVRHAHLQIIFWNAAEHLDPPYAPISEYGWEIKKMGKLVLSSIVAIQDHRF